MREKFDAALDFITQSRKALLETSEVEIRAREYLKGREMEILAKEGVINGKNAEIRAAQLRELTKVEREALTKAEKEKRFAVYRLELALDARRNLESILKIEELEK